jgi:SagB-type dehydrogenase family enzyme
MTEDLVVLARAAVGERMALPAPRRVGPRSLEEALHRRRSIRRFSPEPLTLPEMAQLLWSAYGVTSPQGLRTAPSAGARYPLEVYLACAEGLFHYLPSAHALVKVRGEEVRPALMEAAHGQAFISQAPVCVLFAAVYERTTSRYRERGIRYVHIDLGHAGQNVQLQAEALGLGSVAVGAFDDAAMVAAAQLPAEEEPRYLIVVGRPGKED